MSRLLPDLRFAARTLARQPTLATAALVTLALGIGANSAIFRVVDATLLAPPPFPAAHRVVVAWATSPEMARQAGLAEDKFGVTWGDFYDWQREADAFSRLAMFEPDQLNLSGAGTPEQLAVIRVTGDFSAVLGTRALLGRGLEPRDDVPGRPGVILLSYSRWRQSFAGDRGVVGRKVYLNGSPALVVGVMPPRFTFPRAAEMPAGYGYPVEPDGWVPYGLYAAQQHDHQRRTGQVVGRLRAGVGLEAAEQQLRTISARLTGAHQGDAAAQLQPPVERRSRLPG